ncbi:hypothetical protein MF672_001720 [Actinomadura sp. ATCC 31491]|uniref:Uncharacterized protein n=1 Tax=Actinomadura luzonensis TaxID=2805427 RepID=A0ABT0FJM8_9ACTN|nr:hypothetical protein [Actinomadura luzonensis]MCK2212524.1 hypothetical protein [Actinomadura luzonensis]
MRERNSRKTVRANDVDTSGAAPVGCGSSNASRPTRAASRRRPRSSQSSPYAAAAVASSSATNASAPAGRCAGSLAMPRLTSSRTGAGASWKGTGACTCW